MPFLLRHRGWGRSFGGLVDAEGYIDAGGHVFVDGCGAVDAGVAAANTSDSLQDKAVRACRVAGQIPFRLGMGGGRLRRLSLATVAA